MKVMVQELFGIKGAAAVMLLPYGVVIDKGTVFGWRNIQQPIEDVLRKHLTLDHPD